MNNRNKDNTKTSLKDEFLKHVLNWDPDWFRNKKYRNKIPDVVKNIKLTEGKLHYNNVDEYQDIMFPQLIHECWFSLQKEYEALFQGKRPELKFRVNYEVLSLKHLEVKLSINYSSDNLNGISSIYPCAGDLVELVINQEKYFAYIMKPELFEIPNNANNEISLSLLIDSSLTKTLFCNELTNATIIPITFLETFLALVDVLTSLETFSLCELILSPKADQYRMPSQLKLNISDIATKSNPNPSQLRMISGIIETIEQKIPKICLIQGPPGTGKSNTIVTLIASMLKRNCEIKFLVCAASNKAIDSLALRLIEIAPSLEDEGIPFKIVRIGNEEKVDDSVKKIHLQTMTNVIYKRTQIPRASIKAEILMNSQVITSTLMSCYTSSCMRQVFGSRVSNKLVCIVDEAAQANELCTMIPLTLGVDFFFLIGDHQQLEPIVLSQKAKQYGYNSSLFARAQKIFKNEKNNPPILMLDTQYRMTKSISRWPNKFFYNNNLKDAASISSLGICNYMLFNHNHVQTKNGHANQQEAELVVKLILFLRKKLNLKKNSKITIGVITPYHEQRKLIQGLLNSKKNDRVKKPRKSINIKFDNQRANEDIEKSIRLLENLKLEIKQEVQSQKDDETNDKYIEVNTVDSFQGSERDIIIISCVRSRELGFTKNPNRLNVSITRAKHTMIMFGNFKAFRENSMWLNLIEDATERDVLVNINNLNAESIFEKYVECKSPKESVVFS